MKFLNDIANRWNPILFFQRINSDNKQAVRSHNATKNRDFPTDLVRAILEFSSSKEVSSTYQLVSKTWREQCHLVMISNFHKEFTGQFLCQSTMTNDYVNQYLVNQKIIFLAQKLWKRSLSSTSIVLLRKFDKLEPVQVTFKNLNQLTLQCQKSYRTINFTITENQKTFGTKFTTLETKLSLAGEAIKYFYPISLHNLIITQSLTGKENEKLNINHLDSIEMKESYLLKNWQTSALVCSDDLLLVGSQSGQIRAFDFTHQTLSNELTVENSWNQPIMWLATQKKEQKTWIFASTTTDLIGLEASEKAIKFVKRKSLVNLVNSPLIAKHHLVWMNESGKVKALKIQDFMASIDEVTTLTKAKKLIDLGHNYFLTVDQNKEITIWNAQLNPIYTCQPTLLAHCASLKHGYLALGFEGGRCEIYDTNQSEKCSIQSFTYPLNYRQFGEIFSLAFSETLFLVVGTSKGESLYVTPIPRVF